MSYEEIESTLHGGIHGMDAIIKSRLNQRNDPLVPTKAACWKDDIQLKHSVTAVKNHAEVIAGSCVKLTLLIGGKYSAADLQSLLSELNIQLQSMMGHYYLLVEHPISESLFDLASRVVRSLLGHVRDLAKIIAVKEDLSSVNYLTGMVQKISEEAQKIPLSNRVAYRRHFMENCVEIKTTLDEFQGYIDEAHEKGITSGVDTLQLSASTNGAAKESSNHDTIDKSSNDNDENDDDDDDDGNIDYTPVELQMVESCVQLMQTSLQLVKASLSVITEVSDTIHNNNNNINNNGNNTNYSTGGINTTSASNTAATNAADNNTADGNTADGSTNSKDTVVRKAETTNTLATVDSVATAAATTEVTLEQQCGLWVSSLAHMATGINSGVLNLGAELYPPFEDDRTGIESLRNMLKSCLSDFVNTLVSPSFKAYWTSASNDAVAHLSRAIHDV